MEKQLPFSHRRSSPVRETVKQVTNASLPRNVPDQSKNVFQTNSASRPLLNSTDATSLRLTNTGTNEWTKLSTLVQKSCIKEQSERKITIERESTKSLFKFTKVEKTLLTVYDATGEVASWWKTEIESVVQKVFRHLRQSGDKAARCSKKIDIAVTKDNVGALRPAVLLQTKELKSMSNAAEMLRKDPVILKYGIDIIVCPGAWEGATIQPPPDDDQEQQLDTPRNNEISFHGNPADMRASQSSHGSSVQIYFHVETEAGLARRTAVLGGFVNVSTTIYYLTCAHPLNLSAHYAETGVPLFEEVNTDDISADTSTITQDANSEISLTFVKVAEARYNNERIGTFRQVIAPENTSLGTQKDWALVSPNERNLTSRLNTFEWDGGSVRVKGVEEPTDDMKLVSFHPESQKQRELTIATTSSLVSLPTDYDLHRAYTIRTGLFERGDSGTWIVNVETGTLVGVLCLLPDLDDFDKACMLPAIDVLTDIAENNGMDNIHDLLELPTPSSVTEFTVDSEGGEPDVVGPFAADPPNTVPPAKIHNADIHAPMSIGKSDSVVDEPVRQSVLKPSGSSNGSGHEPPDVSARYVERMVDPSIVEPGPSGTILASDIEDAGKSTYASMESAYSKGKQVDAWDDIELVGGKKDARRTAFGPIDTVGSRRSVHPGTAQEQPPSRPFTLGLFREVMGMQRSDSVTESHAISLSLWQILGLGPKENERDGFYARVCRREAAAKYKHIVLSCATSTCHLLILCLSAVLVGLGASGKDYGIVIASIAGVNVVLAGFITWLKGQDPTLRLRYLQDSMHAIRSEIEMLERRCLIWNEEQQQSPPGVVASTAGGVAPVTWNDVKPLWDKYARAMLREDFRDRPESWKGLAERKIPTFSRDVETGV